MSPNLQDSCESHMSFLLLFVANSVFKSGSCNVVDFYSKIFTFLHPNANAYIYPNNISGVPTMKAIIYLFRWIGIHDL